MGQTHNTDAVVSSLDMTSSTRKAVVVGAGPVGCLAAIALAKQGWVVDVVEGRPDMRTPGARAAAQQRSINLALSARGITAIESVLGRETAAQVLADAIPMRGRMIHDDGGRLHSQAYDQHGQCINSLDRAVLNETLLALAVATPNVRVLFQHKVQSIDFEKKFMVTRDAHADCDLTVPFTLCIGADGSFSVVRRQLMRVVRMEYAQTYIPHEYIELKMPPGVDADGNPRFRMDPNHLHIWPRHSFMLIALPNKDKSFTCTLFAPTETFDELAGASRDRRHEWFKAQFSDALDLIGADLLLGDLERNPRASLISIKASPYHYRDAAILLGDAAHAMVPFYGQGLNCGLEDVRVLDVLLRRAGVPRALDNPVELRRAVTATLSTYSEQRHEDLVAICDLAMQNYTEMRHDVTTPRYLMRKAIDNLLGALTAPAPSPSGTLTYTAPSDEEPFKSGGPSGWLSLYTMVTFRPDIGYATARRRAAQQARILQVVEGGLALGVAGALAWTAWVARRRLL